ncbi:MAG: sugar transferase [Bdellovibrionota bacterium]
MNRRQQSSLLVLRVLVDLIAVTIAWLLAYHLRFYTLFAVPKGVPEWQLYLKLMPFIYVIWIVVFTAAGLYKRTGQHRSPFIEGLDIIQNCFLASLTFIAFTYFYDEYRYSRMTLVFFAAAHPIFMIAGRSLVRKLLRRYRRKLPPRKLLLIGGGDTLSHAIDLPSSEEYSNRKIIGAILLTDGLQREKDQALCVNKGIDVLGDPNDWLEFFSGTNVDVVIFALPHSKYTFLDEHLAEIADQVSEVKMVPDLIRYTRFAAGIDLVDGTPILSINESPLAGFGSVIKRVVDIIGAFIGLILLSPLLAICSLLVLLTSKGPIFYYQDRMGLDGRMFRIYKFRSMPVDAEKNTGAVWATEQDNRPTWIGRIMRRTNLDELPQLFNVLKGEMSLVGPRPERPVFC